MRNRMPLECLSFKSEVNDLIHQLKELQRDLECAAPTMKANLLKEIRQTQAALELAEQELADCIRQHESNSSSV